MSYGLFSYMGQGYSLFFHIGFRVDAVFVLLLSLYKKYICCVSFYVHVFVFLQLQSYEIFATGR
jgi:hypothetical protein